jgi:hypothetical protein
MKVPENAWSTRALLYWDRVGSIIPTKMLDDADAMRERVGDRMLQLQRAGLVEFIAPDPRLQHAWELRSALLEHLKADEGFTKQRQRAFQKGELARLHVDKAGNSLLTGLIELDPARYEDSTEWNAWALVEAEVAAIFMALLACALAGQDDVNMDPTTDDPSSLAAFEYWSSPTDGPSEKRRIQKAAAKNRARTELLKFTLPTPRDDIEPNEIAKFKKKYGKQLMAYRAHVEARSRELAKHADDDEDFQEAANDARVDLAPELEEVRARLKERRWEEDPGGHY